MDVGETGSLLFPITRFNCLWKAFTSSWFLSWLFLLWFDISPIRYFDYSPKRYFLKLKSTLFGKSVTTWFLLQRMIIDQLLLLLENINEQVKFISMSKATVSLLKIAFSTKRSQYGTPYQKIWKRNYIHIKQCRQKWKSFFYINIPEWNKVLERFQISLNPCSV